MLKGYKTYVVGILAILGAAGAYLTGDATLGDSIQVAITAILGMTVRSGIKTEVNK
jgi:hypothetical protein